ncbi:hypothetical protein Tco_0996303 [Tanacetum coccineum]
MSVYDFLCMLSLDKGTVRDEPHGLDNSVLGWVAHDTTLPTPGTAIPRATPEQIVVDLMTRSSNKGPECKVVTKADNAAKRKASTRPEISTNATKKTRSSNKGSRVGSSKQATGDEDEVHIGLDVTYPPIPLPDNEVEPHVELCGGVRRTTRASYHASRGGCFDVQDA